MKFKNFMQLVASSAVLLGISAAAAFGQTTVTFDNVTAPDFYYQVTSGGPDGPAFTTPDVTFTGGVVLNGEQYYGSGEPNPATSGTNLYSTAFPNPNVPAPNNNEIDNGTTPLPGVITGTLATPGEFQTISMDVINSDPLAGSVVITAFNSSNAALETQTINFVGILNDPSLTQEVQHIVLNDSGISYFTVTSPNSDPAAQVTGVAIDTVTLSTPEPSTVAGLVIGCLVVGALFVKRKREMVKSGV